MTDLLVFGNHTQSEILSIITALEQKSEHPLAEAITKYGIENNAPDCIVEHFEAIAGKGVKGTVNGSVYLLGNRKLLTENTIEFLKERDMERLEEEGKTVMIFANEDEIIALIAVADTIKETSKEAVEQLKKQGIKAYMITGDNRRTAEAIGKQLHIDNILAEVLPENKAEEVKKLQQL